MWVCKKFNPSTKEFELLGETDFPKETWGHEFMEYMYEMGWIDNPDLYETDGDEDFMAVCGLREEHGDFNWEYVNG